MHDSSQPNPHAPEVVAPIYWKGPNYGKSLLTPRVLLLGESHIGDVEEVAFEATVRTIENRIEHLVHGQFFGIVEQIVLGRKPLIFEVRRLWEEVAFANFAPVQVVRSEGIKQRHFDGARARFAEMVGELEPDLICFFSKKAWDNRPRASETSWNDAFSCLPVEIDEERTLYPYRNRNALAVRFNHPRGLGASTAEWHLKFAEVFVEATSRKLSQSISVPSES